MSEFLSTLSTISASVEGVAACSVVKVPPGTAQFELVSEELLTGQVVDRAAPPKGFGGPATSGLLKYSDSAGSQQQLPYSHGDLKVPFGLHARSFSNSLHWCMVSKPPVAQSVQLYMLACVVSLQLSLQCT